MGTAHAKERLYGVTTGLVGRDGSPRCRSRHGSDRSPGAGSEGGGGGGGGPPQPAEEPRLSEEDKRYLKETWSTLEADPTSVGIITFTQLFEENPSMKDVFEGFRQIEIDDIRASQELKQHAARVMGFVNKIISRLDSEDKYETLMTDLGCRHVSYGAKPQYIDMMGEQFIMVIRPSLVEANQWSDGAEAAWRKLFQVIGYSMKAGLQARQSVTKETASPRRHNQHKTPSFSRGAGGVTKGTSDVTRTA